EGSRGATASRARRGFRRLLAVSELALAVVLVIGAGLMARTFQALREVDTGFDPANVLSFTLSLPSSSYTDDASVVAFYDRLLRETEALEGVREAAAVRILPLTAVIGDWSIDLEGYEEQPGENPKGDWQAVTPGYFEAMGMRLVEGRLLEPRDDGTATPVVVVNRTMADAYWPDGALGRRFRAGQREWATVVGVVEDVRHNALVEEPRTEMYHPQAQYPAAFGSAPRTMTVVLKGDADPRPLFAAVREVVRRADPSLPLSDVRTMDDVLSDAVAEQRFTATLLGIFGAVALLLAAVGIYSVLAYSVSRRTHEIGIRMALGAGRRRVLRLVVGEGMRLATLGLALGTTLAVGLTRLMTSLLFGVEPLDPLTFATVPALLAACALLATSLPALRASGVPPSEALRSE
ncbi:MAG TPA: FtsX-like permease family protein, partial [Candidatus Thermoplasmatota archaeon]